MYIRFALATLALFAVACGGGGGGGGSLYCSFNTNGSQSCAVYTGLTGAERTAEETACTDDQGTVADSCPTGYVGCCGTSATSGSQTVTTYACYYAGTASDLMSACTSSGGTWATTAP